MKISCKICRKDLTKETIKMFEGKIKQVKCTCVRSYMSFIPNQLKSVKCRLEHLEN